MAVELFLSRQACLLTFFFFSFPPKIYSAAILPRNLFNFPSLAVIGSEARTRNCVKTPAEYVEAFRNRESRCVSKDLIGRISQGFHPATNSSFPLDVSKRAAYFFAGSDALAKFMRIGFPLAVGDFVDPLSRGDFPGLQQISNGQAFLEAVGFSATDIDISTLYVLNIFSRKAIRRAILSPLTNNFTAFEADIPPVRPTWLTVRNFMEDTFQKQGVTVSDAAVDVLENQSFGELTSCPAECSYSPVDFPSATATRAVVRGTRTGNDTCAPPAGPPGAFIQVEPTALDPTSPFCNDTWQRFFVSLEFLFRLLLWSTSSAKANSLFFCRPHFLLTFLPFDKINYFQARYVELYSNSSCDRPRGTPARILNANLARVAESLAADLAAATTPEEETIIFRAFLIQNCSGAFNPLFTGDGLTATGFGGLFSPTSSEYIVSPFYQEEIPSKSKAAIPFCINGQNGGMPNPDGSCALVA